MDNLLRIQMIANDTQRNVHRNYELTIGQDLFGDWSLTIRYGRVGANGSYRVLGSPDPQVVRKQLQAKLGRRHSAKKRIGCAYRTVSISAADGVDVGWWVSSLSGAAGSDLPSISERYLRPHLSKMRPYSKFQILI